MVSGILAYKFGAPFAWITSLSVAAYIAFTLTVTQVLYMLFAFCCYVCLLLLLYFPLSKSLTELKRYVDLVFWIKG